MAKPTWDLNLLREDLAAAAEDARPFREAFDRHMQQLRDTTCVKCRLSYMLHRIQYPPRSGEDYTLDLVCPEIDK